MPGNPHLRLLPFQAGTSYAIFLPQPGPVMNIAGGYSVPPTAHIVQAVLTEAENSADTHAGQLKMTIIWQML